MDPVAVSYAPVNLVSQTQIPPLGKNSVKMTCPYCKCSISTRKTTRCSPMQHCLCFLMCITGVCSICCCLPYFCGSLGSVDHHCPKCNAFLGQYKQ